MVDQDKIKLIKSVMVNYKPTPEEAKKLFGLVENQGRKYQDQLRASTPSDSDRRQFYTL